MQFAWLTNIVPTLVPDGVLWECSSLPILLRECFRTFLHRHTEAVFCCHRSIHPFHISLLAGYSIFKDPRLVSWEEKSRASVTTNTYDLQMFTITNARPFAISTQCGCVARCTPNAQFNFTFYIRTTEHLFFAFLIISYLQILSTLFHKIFKFLFFVYSSKVFDTWAKGKKMMEQGFFPYLLNKTSHRAFKGELKANYTHQNESTCNRLQVPSFIYLERK